MIGLLGAIVAILVLFLWLSVSVLGATQAYAQAESQYIKAVRQASDHLTHYAETGDARAYDAFERALAVPQAYGSIQHGRQSPDADARGVMIEAGSSPQDVDAMVALFPYFETTPALRPALSAWADADDATAQIDALGAWTHRQVEAGHAGSQTAAAVGPQATALAWRVERLGERFAAELAALSRTVRTLLMGGGAALALGLVVVTVWPIRRLSRRLAETNDQFRQIVEHTTDITTVVDAAGTVLYHSPSSRHTVGTTPSELVGRSALPHVHPDDRAALTTVFLRAIETPGSTQSVRYRWRRPDGAEMLLEGLVRNFLGDPAVRGVVITSRDVGDRERALAERAARIEAERVAALATAAEAEAVRAREAAEAARAEAEQMARLQSSFLTNMSHEIRTPLTAVLGYAELLADEVPDHLHEFTGAVRAGGRRLMDTLTALLDLAQIEAGRLVPQPQPTDVAALLEGIVDELRPRAEAAGLALTLEVPPDLPPALVDPALVARVAANLIGNGLKFSDRGRVVVHARVGTDGLELTVRDTGIGIDPAALPGLFDPFRQASEGAARTYEGTGLGLAIVGRVVGLMGGTVTADSAVGLGSTFRVWLPHMPLPDAADWPEAAERRAIPA